MSAEDDSLSGSKALTTVIIGAVAGVGLLVAAGIMCLVLVFSLLNNNAASQNQMKPGGFNNCLANYVGGQYANPLVGQVTSRFGPRPNPFGPGVIPPGFTSETELTFHDGTDIAGVEEGTPFYAAAGGTVVSSFGPGSVDGAGDGGNGIIIDIGSDTQMWYWHAVNGSSKVKKGEQVTPGQELAATGSSGAATAVHLHFSIKVRGKFVDPAKWMSDKGITLGAGTPDQVRGNQEVSPTATAPTGGGGSSIPGPNGEPMELTADQMRNARKIRDVGLSIGATSKDIKIALMTAFQESRLRVLSNKSRYPESANLPNQGDGQDHDSLGLFQQRPESGWGTVAQLMDVEYSTKAFFGGKTGPNHGNPPGLFDKPGYASMPLGAAAQAVQVSAFPTAYDQWAKSADALLGQLGGAGTSQCDPAAGKEPASVANLDQTRQKLLQAAQKGLGGKYVWGGTAFKAWDCSGYVKWVYQQAGITLPRTEQWTAGTSTNTPQPGDLVVQIPDGTNHWSHVGIYAGNGQMYSALNPTEGTLLHPVDWNQGSEYFTLIK